jgi:hypothetical protein
MPVSLRAAARWLGANNDAAKRAKRSAALERLRELEQLLPALSLPESAAEAYWIDPGRAGIEGRDDRQ